MNLVTVLMIEFVVLSSQNRTFVKKFVNVNSIILKTICILYKYSFAFVLLQLKFNITRPAQYWFWVL